MSVVATALRELMALGVSGEALIEAVERIERAAVEERASTVRQAVEIASKRADDELAARKAKAAERTRKHREKKARDETSVAVTSPDVTEPSGNATASGTPTCAGKSLSASSLRSEAYPPERPTVSTPKGSKSQRGERLPDDWRPEADGWTYAVQLLGSEPSAQAQLERFRDYWRAVAGAKGRKLDWPATWRNWCRTASENTARKASHERPHPDARLAAKQANYDRAWTGSERAFGRDREP